MSERDAEFLRFYTEHRIEDQLRFYRSRLDQFDRATGQGLFISATILGFASGAGALAGTATGWAGAWAAVAAILSAASTALAAYLALYAFEQQSKIYGDAARAVRAAARLRLDPGIAPGDQDVTGLAQRVEQALRREQSQWGQLTSQMQLDDQEKGRAGD
jgi:conflict system pore-forming effector with SLATT domain